MLEQNHYKHRSQTTKLVSHLNILRDELELAERSLSVSLALEISKGDFKHTSLQTFRGDTCE